MIRCGTLTSGKMASLATSAWATAGFILSRSLLHAHSGSAPGTDSSLSPESRWGGWLPLTASERQTCGRCRKQPRAKGAAPMEITTIGLDLAKNVFQVHAIDAAGSVVVRKALRRAQVLPFFGKLQPCLMRLMPPAYVKPYVKRGKTDANNAEAICEAVTRPTMRFASIKSEQQQSALALPSDARPAGQATHSAGQHDPRFAETDALHPGQGDGGRRPRRRLNPLIVEDQAERLATLEEGYT
jgi:hypothetical protein